MHLDSKVALVTGASRGIGRAVAISLARIGATVVINYAGNQKAAEEVEKEIHSLGGKAILIQADVSKAERELKWKTHLSLEDMVKDSWNFEKGLDE